MSDLGPLLLMLALAKGGGGGRAVTWPTPSSPPPPPMPPPMPPAGPTTGPTADTATPLADLHARPPEVRQAPAKPPSDKPRPRPKAPGVALPPLKSKRRTGLPPHVLKAALKQNAKTIVQPPMVVPTPDMRDVSVLAIQKTLAKRGAKLVRDGLYGPKTTAAWQAAARRIKQSPLIYRVSAKVARVPAATFDLLDGPVVV